MSEGRRIVDEPLREWIGERTAKAFAKLRLHSVGDLLRHFPRRYERLGEFTDLEALPLDEQVTVMATVARVSVRQMRRRRGTLVEAVVTDGRGELTLTFFSQPWREKELQPGRLGLFTGKVSGYRGSRQLAHPDYVLIDESGRTVSGNLKSRITLSGGLIPVYPASASVRSWDVALAVRVVLDRVDELDDPIPEAVRERHGLVDLRAAFGLIHRPDSDDDVRTARRRLRFEEAFVLQAELARRRAEIRALATKPRAASTGGGLLAAFDAQLPFTLTDGQREVSGAILDDLARPYPMHRLLQGEVGSGKTVVALRAMLAVVDAGGQAALLAPTEVLAQQHHRSIRALLGPLGERGMLGGSDVGTTVALLTGSMGTAARRSTMLDIVSGDAGIVIGTHALLQEKVSYADLGLIVVDEQHRFGVEQRAALAGKSLDSPPHTLVLTATPIPRTVAMTVFGDLEVSTLTELPRGRAPISTTVVPVAEAPTWLDRVWQRVREDVERGHQVYIVCPRIGAAPGEGDADEPSVRSGAKVGGAEGEHDEEAGSADDDADARGVDGDDRRPAAGAAEVLPMLVEGPLAGLRVELLHGQLPGDLKESVMRRFAAGDVDVLVATTVIEVGVDVANAATMVVLDADRFGISQLHQLRGRVGRGSVPGLCLLVTELPAGSAARDRLDAVASTLDGFELSRVDLEQRREGDVLGAEQSGRRSSLRLLSVIRDEKVIATARDEATRLVDEDPTLRSYAALHAEIAALTDDARADYLDKT